MARVNTKKICWEKPKEDICQSEMHKNITQTQKLDILPSKPSKHHIHFYTPFEHCFKVRCPLQSKYLFCEWKGVNMIVPPKIDTFLSSIVQLHSCSGYGIIFYFIQKLLLHNISISVLFLSRPVSQSGHCFCLQRGEARETSHSKDMFWFRR